MSWFSVSVDKNSGIQVFVDREKLLSEFGEKTYDEKEYFDFFDKKVDELCGHISKELSNKKLAIITVVSGYDKFDNHPYSLISYDEEVPKSSKLTASQSGPAAKFLQ